MHRRDSVTRLGYRRYSACNLEARADSSKKTLAGTELNAINVLIDSLVQKTISL